MLRLRRKGVIKWTIWGVVAAFALSIFLFAGMFFSGSDRSSKDDQANTAPKTVKPRFIFDEKARPEKAVSLADRDLTLGEVEGVFNTIEPKYKKQFASDFGIESLVGQLVTEKIKLRLAGRLGLDADAVREVDKQLAAAEGNERYAQYGGYKGYIESQGMDWETFKERIKASFVNRSLEEKVTMGKLVTEEAKKAYFEKNKDILYKDKKYEDVTSDIESILMKDVTEADARAFYDQFSFIFKTPPAIALRQILINPENPDRKAKAEVAETEIKTYYDEKRKEEFACDKAGEFRQVLIKYNDPAKNEKLEVPVEELKAHFEASPDKYKVAEGQKVALLAILKPQGAELGKIQIEDAEARKYYEDNKGSYTQRQEARAFHILITCPEGASSEDETKAREEAERIHNAIVAGEDFGELARKHSGCPSASKGGDLDWFGRGAMAKEFEDAAFALKEGEISQPVRTKFGYHIIKGGGIREEKIRPFEEVSASILETLRREKAAKDIEALAAGLAEKAKGLTLEAFLALKAEVTNYRVQAADLGIVADGAVLEETRAVPFKGGIVSEAMRLDGRVSELLRGLAVGSATSVAKTDNAFVIALVHGKVEGPSIGFDLLKRKIRTGYLTEFAKKHFKVQAEKILSDLKARMSEAVKPDAADSVARVSSVFAEIAKLHSDGKTRDAGGLLPKVFKGRQPKGMIPADMAKLRGEIVSGDNVASQIEEPMFNLRRGDYSEVLESPFGYHILFCENIETLEGLPFEMVKEEIREKLQAQKADQAAKSEIDKVAEKARAGEDFAKLAELYSEAPSKSRGGDLGLVPVGDAIEDQEITARLKGEIGDSTYRMDGGRFTFGFFIEGEVSKELKFLNKGDLSEVVKSRFGYHLLKVDDISDGTLKPFDEVKDEIIKSFLDFSVPDEECRKIYDTRKASYEVEESVTARQIVCRTRREAEEALSKIREGKDSFEDLAKIYSCMPSAQAGGYVGVVQRGEMSAEWEQAAFTLKKDEVSGVVETSMGFHIIKVEDRGEARTIPYEEKADEIRQAEVQRKKTQAYSTFIDRLGRSERPVYHREAYAKLSKIKEYAY